MNVRKWGWNDTGVDSNDTEVLEPPSYSLKEGSGASGDGNATVDYQVD